MMGRTDGQMQMIVLDLSELIPANHLLRKIDASISFLFIYDLLAPFYPAVGRSSVDPVSMFKMLLMGYLYGIKSELRPVQEIQLNIAYRWFCGFEPADKIPDHSTFSRTRIRKWNDSQLFSKVFIEIVRQCIEAGLVDGKGMAADGSHLPAQASRNSWVDLETTVEQSMFSYLDALDQELSEQPGFKNHRPVRSRRRSQPVRQIRSAEYIHHGDKRGVGMIPAIQFPNSPAKFRFQYLPQQDCFLCPMRQSLTFHRMNCHKSTGKYLRRYQVQGDACQNCSHREGCFDKAGVRRRILASSCYPAFHRGHDRVGTPEYWDMIKKRKIKIWIEGSFSVMKREHNLSSIRKRGILAATEECLRSVMALNLKRMVNAIFLRLKSCRKWAENVIPQLKFCFCQ